MHEGHRERMYGRLYEHGESFTDCELLETLLYNFITRKNTNPIAHRLLDCFGDMYGVFHATPRMLSLVSGIGKKTAEQLYLLGNIFRKVSDSAQTFTRLYNYGEVADFIGSRFEGLTYERLDLYMTDSENVLICTKSVTCADGSKVDIDDNLLSCILTEVQPVSLIVAHNHPSGDCNPSKEDDAALERIGKVCRMHGVFLRESAIYTKDGTYSYYLQNRIEKFR